MKCAPARARAFSIIELLVVISIISVAIAMLMPAIGRAKESARRTICSTNLRQFGQGFATYATDFKQKYLNTAWNGPETTTPGNGIYFPYWWRMTGGNETNFPTWNSQYNMTNSIHLDYIKNHVPGISMATNTVSGIWGCPSFNFGGFGWGVSNYQTGGNSRRMQALYSYWSAEPRVVAFMQLNHPEDFGDAVGDGAKILMSETQFYDADSSPQYWYPAHPDEARRGIAYRIVSGVNPPLFGNNQLYRDGHVIFITNKHLTGADLTAPSSAAATGIGLMNTQWGRQFYLR